MRVKPIPDGYHAVTPYLIVANVAQEIDFLTKAFGAEVLFRMDTPGGTTHAEVKIRDSMIMLGQAQGDKKPMPTMLYLYVEDADEAFNQAVKAGGTIVMRPKDQFYGDRSGAVKDENNIEWWLASRKENLTDEEISKRAFEAYKQKAHT